MRRPDRDYLYLDSTEALCPDCLERVPAKLSIRDGKLYLNKRCRTHGQSLALLEEDAGYYLSQMQYLKPGTISRTQMEIKRGCPFDCGLCPDHEQHSCISVIDITQSCNLTCPTCYATSSAGDYLDLNTVAGMVDFLIESEFGETEIIQISGGEPTTHPQILEILEMVKSKNVKYLMLNTNGIRIAEDEKFAEQLARFKGRFEIYLQFDGFDDRIYRELRGRDLLSVKMKAIEHLVKYKIPTTLVTTVRKGLNDHEIGKLIGFGLKTPYIRGINFQPVAYFGRVDNTDPLDRSTLTGIVSAIEKQTGGKIRKSDLIPLPCDPHKISIGYLVREKKGFVPLTRKLDIRKHLSIIDNSFAFKPQDFLQNAVRGLWSFGQFFSSSNSIKDMACCIPLDPRLMLKTGRMEYIDRDTFRISIVSFSDAYNMDMNTIKQECVHFVTPDRKKFPFSTYNTLYRSTTR